MSELLEDKWYRRFLETKPTLPSIARNKRLQTSPPWTVYVQREVDGKWGKKAFWKYSEAFNFARKALRLGVHDVAINCKRVASKPPYRLVRIRGRYVIGSDGKKRQATKRAKWLPNLGNGQPDHTWCPYCRRPTVFKYYRKHPALKGLMDTTKRRCCICGCSEALANGRFNLR